MTDIKQGTVNLVIIIAAIIVAAGSWATPMMIAQTGHTIGQQINNAVDDINENTDDETDQVEDSLLGDAGDAFEEGGCNLADMLLALSTDTELDVLCDTDVLEQNYIHNQPDFQDFSTVFELKPTFLQMFPSELLPARGCAEPNDPLTPAQQFDGVSVTSANADKAFGTVACFHGLSFADPPKRLKALTVENGLNGPVNIRLQVAIVEDEGGNDCGDDAVQDFEPNIVFDIMVGAETLGAKVTVAHDGEVLFLPDANKNICIRVADDSGDNNTGATHKVWMTVIDELPLDVFSFAPPPAFTTFEFETFSPLDFSNTCGLEIDVVKPDGTNAGANIPVVLLAPVIAGEQVGATNAQGKVFFGEGNNPDSDDGNDPANEKMPSGFYIIDVNVDHQTDFNAVAPNQNFGFAFPDQPIDCNNGGIDDEVEITVTLPEIEPTDVEVQVTDKDGTPIQGLACTLTGTDFFGNPIAQQNDTTDVNGECQFPDLTNGDYNLNVDGGADLNDADFFISVFPGSSPFLQFFATLLPA